MQTRTPKICEGKNLQNLAWFQTNLDFDRELQLTWTLMNSFGLNGLGNYQCIGWAKKWQHFQLYVNTMPNKLQNTRYLYCVNNFNTC